MRGFIKQIKRDPTPTFKKKGNEKQWKFNTQVEEKLMSVSAALQETPSAIERKEPKQQLKRVRNSLILDKG